MIQEIIQKWDKNKPKLEEYFKNTPQSKYDTYKQIVIKLLELVINDEEGNNIFDIKKMTIIDDGDYQGTQIFIIPKKTYQPSIEEYIVTHTYYGSCSSCDTLQGISNYSDELPNEEQLKEYMTLALHLVQKIHWLEEHDYNKN
jgi:hypothetical protein